MRETRAGPGIRISEMAAISSGALRLGPGRERRRGRLAAERAARASPLAGIRERWPVRTGAWPARLMNASRAPEHHHVEPSPDEGDHRFSA